MAADLSADAAEFKPGQVWSTGTGNAATHRHQGSTEDFSKMQRGGYWNNDLGWWSPYHLGQLKSFNVRSGYGFLECEQTKDIYNSDVYIHKSMVPVVWKIGQHVEFAVSQNARGQPQAHDAMWFPANVVPKERQHDQANAAGRKQQNAQASLESRHIGTVKSYSNSQGYGFISSEAMLENHSCDVYLDRGQLHPSGDWRPGQVIEFDVVYNRRGQPQARNVNWDPVPVFAHDAPMPSLTRAVDIHDTRNLNQILRHMRNGDKSAAIRAVIEFQASSQSIDYVAFALDRFGPPSQEIISQVEEGAPLALLVLTSKMLMAGQVDTHRVPTAVQWCEEIATFLCSAGSPESGGAPAGGERDIDREVIKVAKAHFEQAAMQAVTMPSRNLDAGLFDTLIAKLTEALANLI
eukprot:TRINITY_DN43045_c0_g1_i1.p1 TRINITY_DN43045_c0_g1~~TRINITY_DN43045_c0_g1_i1.p1  ORF type:complete len:423 (-),score=59.37 TRINITY_DN43045_c0_g1_i1:36-1253(-)